MFCLNKNTGEIVTLNDERVTKGTDLFSFLK